MVVWLPGPELLTGVGGVHPRDGDPANMKEENFEKVGDEAPATAPWDYLTGAYVSPESDARGIRYRKVLRADRRSPSR